MKQRVESGASAKSELIAEDLGVCRTLLFGTDKKTEDYLPGAVGGPAWGCGLYVKHI